MGSTTPENTPPRNALPLLSPLRSERQGDDCSLREILNGDTKGQGKCACRRDLWVIRKKTRIHHAHRHPLRDVMQRNSQHHHDGTAQIALRAFRLFTSHMEVRDQVVKYQQKQYTAPEACKSRKER